jgi:shikimate kinase
MPKPIVLIGPGRSGKRSVGIILAERLGQPFYDLDKDAERYHDEAGIDREQEHQAWVDGGFEGWHRYRAPFEVKAIERGLAEHPNSVIKLGTVQSFYDDSALREQVARLMSNCIVLLLLPDPDLEQAITILQQRSEIRINGQEFTEYFVRHPANYELAKHTIYTDGRTPDESCAEMISLLDQTDPTIILIGPMNAGKSTLGDLLEQRLQRKRIAVDRVRWGYYAEIGFEQSEQDRIAEREGFDGVLRYWKPFEIHAIERILAEHPGAVIDFGAGHSVYDEPEQMARIRAALAPLANVFLITPSPDPTASIAILRDRMTPKINGIELNRYIIATQALHQLANRIIYTTGKTPEETAEEIIRSTKDATNDHS